MVSESQLPPHEPGECGKCYLERHCQDVPIGMKHAAYCPLISQPDPREAWGPPPGWKPGDPVTPNPIQVSVTKPEPELSDNSDSATGQHDVALTGPVTCPECGAVDAGARQGINHSAGCMTALDDGSAFCEHCGSTACCAAGELHELRQRIIDAARAFTGRPAPGDEWRKVVRDNEYQAMCGALNELDAVEHPDPWRLLARAHTELNQRIGASRNRVLEAEIDMALAMQEQADD